MLVRIVKPFDAYPKGKRVRFEAGADVDLPKTFVDEARLIEKGLARLAITSKPETE